MHVYCYTCSAFVLEAGSDREVALVEDLNGRYSCYPDLSWDDNEVCQLRARRAVQPCSIENQKGTIAVRSVAMTPFWFSMEHL